MRTSKNLLLMQTSLDRVVARVARRSAGETSINTSDRWHTRIRHCIRAVDGVQQTVDDARLQGATIRYTAELNRSALSA